MDEQSSEFAKIEEDRAAEGRAYCKLAVDCLALGEFKQAIEYLNHHRSISKEVGDRKGERCAYEKLGNAYQGLGDLKQAMEHHKQCLCIAKEMGDRYIIVRACDNLGSDYQQLGNFKQAIECYKQCLRITKEEGYRAEEGRVYGKLGIIFDTVGDCKQAVDYLEQSLTIAKEVGNRRDEMCAFSNLGLAYCTLGDFENATEYHKQELSIAKELGDTAGEGYAYLRFGKIRKGLGDIKGAIEYYQQGLKTFEEVGDKKEIGHAYCKLGECFQRLGDLRLAKEYHTQHLEVAREVGDRYGEACACFSLGSDFKQMSCLQDALEFYQCSVKVFNDMRSLLQAEDLWKVNFRDMHRNAYTALWSTLEGLSKTDEALFAAEQGRAQALLDVMELQYGLDVPMPGSLDLKEIIPSTVSDVSQQIVFVALEGNKINLWVLCKGFDAQFKQNELDVCHTACFLEALTKDAFKENQLGRCVKCEDRSLEKLRDELKSSDDRSLEKLRDELTCTEESVETVQLSQGNNNSLHLLYSSIFHPIANLLQGDEVIIVPDGPLCLAPFAAFVDDKSRYLSESIRIRIVPSLTSLKVLAECPDDYHAKSGALLVGDPCLEEIKKVFGKPKLAQLPFARKEVTMIGDILKSVPLTGKEATKAEVLKRISSVALVHIAAHGKMGSGEIALAPNPARKYKTPREKDYILKIADVQSVQLRARLVVLSCCHSGKGEIKAEGVVGIARAFLCAGARSVLVSLWAIDDEATMEFMKSFYQNLSDGNSASLSLNQAMKCLRESEKFCPVKYWAPFVLIGDNVTLEFGEKQEKHCK